MIPKDSVSGEKKRPFLLEKMTQPDWSAGKKVGFWIWNILWVLLGGVGIGVISLILAVGPYPQEFMLGYLECPLIIVLNLLPVLALVMLLYGLIRRASVSFLITAVVVLGFSAGNYFKLLFRDDPLMFADLFLLKEAGDMAGKYNLVLNGVLIAAIVFVVCGFLILHFFVRGKPPVVGRAICAAVGLITMGGLYPAVTSPTVYNVDTSHYDHLDNIWSATQQYISRGFVYPFLHSVTEAFETPPDGYSEKGAEAILEQYQDADIPEDKKVNVVGVMLEAYNDFTKFGVPELAQDVYAVWHQLEEEGYSGNLVTNIFGGGTIDTERCFLTGYSTLQNFRGKTNSYVWYFRDQGYRTGGLHPCYQWFYNRVNVNKNLGFQDYLFVENHFEAITGGLAADDIFFPELIKAYEEGTADGQPYFSFSVTYQGHGPYSAEKRRWGEPGDFVVNNGQYTDDIHCIMENYFGSVANTNENLRKLTDYFRNDDKPVVLVLFGDHNPWMGDGNAGYTAVGLDFDMSTQKGFYDYYATRYIIWANEAAKKILGSDFTGEGPDIGPYFLMNELFRLCGWTGPAYMQYTNSVADHVSVIHNTWRYVENGILTDSLEEENAEMVRDYRRVQYYWRHNFKYTDF